MLVVTDGGGDPPDAILAADRERTRAILIPPGDVERARPWSARQIVLGDLRSPHRRVAGWQVIDASSQFGNVPPYHLSD